MDLSSFNLRKLCHINTNEDGDRFVGVKIDKHNINICFPLGYSLPEDDRMIRRDIRNLLNVLSAFSNKEDRLLKGNKYEQEQSVCFPIQAYIDVLDHYMNNNGTYYTETEKTYKTDTKGKIDWCKTVKEQTPYINKNNFVFTNVTIVNTSQLKNQLITRIHKYCVYQAHLRLGWLYNNQQIQDPGIQLNNQVFIQELTSKFSYANKDKDKKLFKAMITMLEFIDDKILDKQFYFGTERFEYVWEQLIDKVFGLTNKSEYFPKATWIERQGYNNIGKETNALLPDTIMVYNDKVYVIDAKYYRYGVTHNANHLPDSSSINKQITYGEYICNKKEYDTSKVFNAFLMPYNKKENYFETNEIFANVAEAQSKWKTNKINYEKIQGIVVDITYLMENYLGNHDSDKMYLAETIEKYNSIK